jgi:hypothetical protein
MTDRLPVVGGDRDAWGTVLSGYLGVAHNADGTLKGAAASRAQILQSAYGVLTDNGLPYFFSTQTALTSQTVFVELLGLRAGDQVVGIKMRNGVAASGTGPTTVRAGIADSSRVILALSGNVNAAATWPVGVVSLPLTAPYTILADGGYFACVVVNGTWSVTQPTPYRAVNIAGGVADGAFPAISFNWTGQTDLPAIGNPLTNAGTGSNYYMGFY